MILYRPGRWFMAHPDEQIVGFHRRTVHGHAETDSDIVWAIVQNEVLGLLESSGALLDDET